MLCLRGFKQYSRWVPLLNVFPPSKVVVVALQKIELLRTLEFIKRIKYLGKLIMNSSGRFYLVNVEASL